MKPVYRKDKNVACSNHGSCLQAFCPMCGEHMGEYPPFRCSCGIWKEVEGTGKKTNNGIFYDFEVGITKTPIAGSPVPHE